MKDTVIITPAYDRRYQEANAVVADWEAGKDFKILNGPYLSIRDADAFRHITIVGWEAANKERGHGSWTAIVIK